MMKYARLKWKAPIPKHLNQLMSLTILCARKSTSYDLFKHKKYDCRMKMPLLLMKSDHVVCMYIDWGTLS
jgi:hypothetical protein